MNQYIYKPFVTIALLIAALASIVSCSDSLGIDPYVKKYPKKPVDTSSGYKPKPIDVYPQNMNYIEYYKVNNYTNYPYPSVINIPRAKIRIDTAYSEFVLFIDELVVESIIGDDQISMVRNDRILSYTLSLQPIFLKDTVKIITLDNKKPSGKDVLKLELKSLIEPKTIRNLTDLDAIGYYVNNISRGMISVNIKVDLSTKVELQTNQFMTAFLLFY